MARVEKIIWTLEISKDLEDIYNFYAEKSERAANRVIEEIISEVENLKFARRIQPDEFRQQATLSQALYLQGLYFMRTLMINQN